MEDLLIIILQVVGEFLYQLLGCLPWDLGYVPSEDNRWLLYISGFSLGLGLGWLSLAILPNTFIPYGWLRIANILLAPMFSGTLAKWIARFRQQRNAAVDPRFHYWLSFCVTLGLTLYRFTYAARIHP